MSGLEIGLTGFAVLLVLLALRIPIGVAMLSVGIVGYVTIAGENALFSYLKTLNYLGTYILLVEVHLLEMLSKMIINSIWFVEQVLKNLLNQKKIWLLLQISKKKVNTNNNIELGEVSNH